MKKKINKPLRLFLKGLKYFCLLLVLTVVFAIGTLYYKLQKEPVDLSFLLPQVESYVSPSGNLHLSADSIVLTASATRLGLFHVQIDNLELKDKQDLTIIALPNVKFSYGILQLLSLNPIPKTVYVPACKQESVAPRQVGMRQSLPVGQGYNVIHTACVIVVKDNIQ